jgi:hypothetical protein
MCFCIGLFYRAPKAVQRHTALACWVEKEVLECSNSDRHKMVENLIETMYYLFERRNFFSYTSLWGAFQQRSFLFDLFDWFKVL